MPKVEENSLLVEPTMEKGNNSRHQTSSSKSAGSENKNKADGVKFSRFPRCKEGNSPRPDARRKPNPQKNRDVFDKRPRTRNGSFYERYRNEVATDFNVGSHPKQGSKKVSLNHLLNFTLTPVDNRDCGTRPINRSRFKWPKYNKELFLQANCQFVTQDDGNYTLHNQNPDVLIDWALIEEVRLPSFAAATCPICLYPPVAAKITRCGHIYCWSCILHYLALTDRSWQKCPICFEAVHKNDLKSVVCVVRKQMTVGTEVTMCLMKREKGSMIPVPAICEAPPVCKINDDECITRFQKLLLASKNEVKEIIKHEHSELQEQLLMNQNAPEICFLEAALKLLEERENNLEVIPPSIKEENYHHEMNNNGIMDNFMQEHNYNQSSEIGEGTSTSDSNQLFLDNTSESDYFYNSSKKESDAYYFYQAEDGQHIYLHSLNVRMLVKEFGSLKDSPPVVKAKIVELENISMTESLRKRLRYLQHIPLTCEFQVAELDFQVFLPEPILEEFSGEILKRQKLRKNKAREERRREKYIAEEENKKLGKFPLATYNINSVDQFPVCRSRQNSEGKDYMSSSPGKNEYDLEYPTVGISNLSIENATTENATTESCSSPTTSFAQMLREGNSNFNSSSPWTQRKNIEAVATRQAKDDDDHATVPEYHQSFSDAFQIALESAIKNSSNDNTGTNGQNSKKKKKEKRKVLFTTSMCRK